MALVIGRNWVSAVLVALIAAVVTTGWLWPGAGQRSAFPGVVSTASAAGGEAETPPLDPRLYNRVQQLRQELCVGNEDLAALGCSSEQARAILTALLNWGQAREAELNQTRAAEHQARRALQEGLRQLNIGPRNQGLLVQMPALKQAVAVASQRHQQVLAAAPESVSGLFSASQRQSWMALRNNAKAGTPVRYRYAGELTPDQLRLLRQAQRRSALGGPLLSQVEQTQLTSLQRSSMQTAQANLMACLAGVLEADQTVLPLPRELQMLYSSAGTRPPTP